MMSDAMPGRLRATLTGGLAILLWSTLAVLTAATGAVPPFQLTAMTFAIAFLLALVKWLWRGEKIVAHLTLPCPVWALGVGGMFGNHALYFLALRHAPPVEAGLINYLWPLLIVLFSALLPGERLRWFHLAGAGAGLFGTTLLMTGGTISLQQAYLPGYAAALTAAFVWATYSVTSRRFRTVPSDAVGSFCGATALLALLAHLALETSVWPDGMGQWLALLGLGLGPVGAAFYLWDRGVKFGNIQALGILAYAAPLLSTLLLILFGWGAANGPVPLACLLIAGGGLVGSGYFFRSPGRLR